MIRAILTALLSLFPHNTQQACMQRRFDAIVEQATFAAAHNGVPAPVLFAVGFQESHCGCDEPDWGAPAPRSRSEGHRHGLHWRRIAGTPDDAARILANGFRTCGGSWQRAVTWFRSGSCALQPTDRRQRYVHIVMGLAGQLERAAQNL